MYKRQALGVSGFSMTPVFSKDTNTYDVIVNSSVTSVDVQASAISGTASISGNGTVSLNGGTTEVKVRVQAQNGDVREYTIRIVQSPNGPMLDSSLSGTSQGSGPGGSPASVTPAGEGGVSPGTDSQGPGVSDNSGLTAGNTDGPGGSSVTVIN